MEARLFDPGTVPDCSTPEWYRGRDRAPHLEQAAHRERLTTVGDLATYLISVYRLATVVDLGAGDGGLLSLLAGTGVRAWGYDLQPTNVEAAVAQRGVDVRCADFLADPIDWADLAICTEVLEHLVDPHRFVRQIAQNCRYLIASSPANEDSQHHYEHHLWAWDAEGYRELVEGGGWQVMSITTVNAMFQVVMACVP